VRHATTSSFPQLMRALQLCNVVWAQQRVMRAAAPVEGARSQRAFAPFGVGAFATL
jgi:hypothetical protein